MKIPLIVACICSIIPFSSKALPTYFIGEFLTLELNDFTKITQFYKQEDGVDLYATTGYQIELDTYGSEGLVAMNFDVSGNVNARWFSSNLAMQAKLYCNNQLVASDEYQGIRIGHMSFSIKPYIDKPNHPIPTGCQQLKLELNKLGSLSRQYFTQIDSAQLRVYLTLGF